jgi:hypothetical protein
MKRIEPVVDIAVVKHGLEGRETDRHQRDAEPVALAQQTELRRTLGQGKPKRREHHHARREVDVKHPRPAVIIGQVAADRRPDRRRERCADGKSGQADRLFRARQHDHDDRESERDQDAAGKASQRAKHDHLGETVRMATQHREEEE